MQWQFSNDAPIYTQLIHQVKVGIVTGAIALGAGYGNRGRGQPQYYAEGPGGIGAGRPGLQPADRRQICDGG